MLRRTLFRRAAVLNADGIPTAATVLACRTLSQQKNNSNDAQQHNYEILFIKRSKQMKFMPNLYAFPGGKVDPEDATMAAEQKQQHPEEGKWMPERYAVMRELAEEVGMLVRPDGTLAADKSVVGGKSTEALKATSFSPSIISSLIPFQQWVTPKEESRRFDTAFFLLPCKQQEQSLELFPNEGEISEARWLSPARAAELHNTADSEFRLPPPTQIVIHMLCQPQFRDAAALFQCYRELSSSGGGVQPILAAPDVSTETGDFVMNVDLSAVKPGYTAATKVVVGGFGYPIPGGFLKGKELSAAAKENPSPKMVLNVRDE